MSCRRGKLRVVHLGGTTVIYSFFPMHTCRLYQTTFRGCMWFYTVIQLTSNCQRTCCLKAAFTTSQVFFCFFVCFCFFYEWVKEITILHPYRLWLQCARLHEASQSHLQAKEVDQDFGGENQTAAQVLPHWGEVSLPQQFLCTDSWSWDSGRIPNAQTHTLLHQDCKVHHYSTGVQPG